MTKTNTVRDCSPKRPLRYQIQTRAGSVWDIYSTSDDLATATASARTARSTGYHTRLVDSRTDAIVSLKKGA